MESRNEKFKRIATRRTNNILNQIRLLGNLSNKSTYEYSEEEVNKIFSAIESLLKIAKVKFHSHRRKEFKL
ncbi:MAG: hypothetical protein A3C22_00675 [Candidatus Levybacteria bacterium RIFCSPHIGHO2_02_FULL_37_10]|nr:MAG: hypothetical protein A3C22_00675 [Candidatus Levybacteria bacterium RIFCSPHIGHO2_02_FULL_37_10]